MNEDRLFEMLGQELTAAVKGARERTSDGSIMVTISAGLCIIERRGEVVQGGLSQAGAVEMLSALPTE